MAFLPAIERLSEAKEKFNLGCSEGVKLYKDLFYNGIGAEHP
jgi:hypothetical protein